MEIGTNMRTAVDQCYINPWNSQKIEFSIVEPQYYQPNFIGETNTYNPALCNQKIKPFKKRTLQNFGCIKTFLI